MAIQVNTHHAYLNQEIIIRTDVPTTLRDKETEKVYFVDGEIALHLSAGEHTLCDVNSAEELHITIEDAIKLGGSQFKKGASFISNSTPWVFITMLDRLYIYNQETKQGRVEFCVTPDEIIFTGHTSRNIFILKTNEDYTIWDVAKNKVLLQFSNKVYYNEHLVVFKEQEADSEEETLTVYNYVKDTFTSIPTPYSIYTEEKNMAFLFFASKGCMKSYNLLTDETKEIIEVPLGETGRRRVNLNFPFCLYQKYVVFEYDIIDLVEESSIPFSLQDSARVLKIMSEEIFSLDRAKEECNSFADEFATISSKYTHLQLLTKFASINKIFSEGADLCMVYTINCYTIRVNSHQHGYLGSNVEYHCLNISKKRDEIITSIEYFNLMQTRSAAPPMQTATKYIASTEQDDKHIVQKDETLWIVGNTGHEENILSDLFDNTFCTNAYFTSDGKQLLLRKNMDKGNHLFNLESFSSISFPVEGPVVSKNAAFNGYKPYIEVVGNDQLRWVDPITMQRVNNSEENIVKYVSPNGKIVAETAFITERIDKLSNRKLESDCENEFDWHPFYTAPNKEQIIAKRRQLVERNRSFFIQQLKKHDENIKDQKDLDRKLESLIEYEPFFTSAFVDYNAYVSYTDNGVEKTIYIDKNVWFLNYISFSKDSRYLAIGAKLKGDAFDHNEAGVFVVYDLVEQKEILRKGREDNLYAVWTTQFSSKNMVACYDSHPNTYIKDLHDDKALIRFSGRSFLCFSPTGKYVALSEQGYIDKEHHPYENWGHQPSTNVYIYDIRSLSEELFLQQYNDLGEAIVGTKKGLQSKKNIASVAFSSDEKRLLMVGEDGVVVVRNLHLPSKEEDSSEHVGNIICVSPDDDLPF